MRVIVYKSVQLKLEFKHSVSESEVIEAFKNFRGTVSDEVRQKNLGTEPRYWFISKTNKGRMLKVVFFFDTFEKIPVVITAYSPNEAEVNLYEKGKKNES